MTKELKGITILIATYFAGELISRLIVGFIPGSVVGMLLLFGMLQYGIVKEDDVKSVANFILKNMMLFFVPISVGVMVSYKMISANWLAVTLTLLVTTLMVMVVVGVVQQMIGRKWKK